MDTITPIRRSHIMSRIRGKNTNPELQVRKALYRAGVRYRLHDSRLPGKPDIAIKKYLIIVQIHGCFWHGHENCPYGHLPKSNVAYWREKIAGNKIRDKKNNKKLQELGFTIFEIWECEIKNEKYRRTLNAIVRKWKSCAREKHKKLSRLST